MQSTNQYVYDTISTGLKRIGKGGFGSIYACNRENVVKISQKADIETLNCIKNEINIYQKLKQGNYMHMLNMVALVDDTIHSGFIMQRADVSLRQLFRFKTIALAEFKHIIGQTLRAIHELHQLQIVHSDIKPDNIMLKYDSNGNFKVFLIDFGLSSYINGGEYTASSLKGTDKYIDPILVIDSELSQYADLWALGVMILTRLAPQQDYKMLLTQHLYELKTIDKWPVLYDKLIQDRIKTIEDSSMRQFLVFLMTTQKQKRVFSQQVLQQYTNYVAPLPIYQFKEFFQPEFPVFTYISFKKKEILVYATQQHVVIRQQQRLQGRQDYPLVAISRDGLFYFNNGEFIQQHREFIKQTTTQLQFPCKLKQKQFTFWDIHSLKLISNASNPQLKSQIVLFTAENHNVKVKCAFNLKLQQGLTMINKSLYMYSNDYIFPITLDEIGVNNIFAATKLYFQQ